MAACIPTMRPVFQRVWKNGTSTGRSQSGSHGHSTWTGRSRLTHQRDGFATDVTLEDMDSKYDTASRESQQGIVRTLEVSMGYDEYQQGEFGHTKDNITPKAIAESGRSVDSRTGEGSQ